LVRASKLLLKNPETAKQKKKGDTEEKEDPTQKR
jgi:hypothetical protein